MPAKLKSLTKDSIIWPDFFIYQSKNGYRFSLDSIILSRLVKAKRNENILEIGSGSGVISLILARFYLNCSFKGVEIQRNLFELSKLNLKTNGQLKNVNFLNSDIKTFVKDTKYKFDSIVSNPPFYKKGSGKICPNREEALARHELKLSARELLQCAKLLLKPKGRLDLIYPTERVAEILKAMPENNLEAKIMINIHSAKGSASQTTFLRAQKEVKSGLKVLSPLFVYGKNGKYTSDMKDFYSKSPHSVKKLYPAVL